MGYGAYMMEKREIMLANERIRLGRRTHDVLDAVERV